MRIDHCIAAAAAVLTAGTVLAPSQALAWGHTGHVMISQLAAQGLPADVPAFVRNMSAVREIGELGPEPDISKSTGNITSGTYPNIRTAGTIHDFERDPGHYIDLQDDGLVLGGVRFAPLYSSRRDFDTAVRASTTLTAPNNTMYFTGYLPYEIADGWYQIRKDFAWIRAYTAAIANPGTSAANKAVFQYQLQLRQILTLRDIGVWSHYVADGSQPMHVSVHFNGWGNYPNPNNYTTAPIHAPFEGSYVKANVTSAMVAAKIAPYRNCSCSIETRITDYLGATLATIDETYQFADATNLYANPNAAATDFIAARLAASAGELRDQITDAWRQSANVTVGYPLIPVSAIEAGQVITPNDLAGD